jgi:hypothetical protein
MARQAVAAGLVTALMAFAGLLYRAETVRTVSSSESRAYAPAFRGERTGPGAMMNAHDGQAFGSLALDPLLSRPADWDGGKPQMAYRAARPLLGWLVALSSFGSARAAAWSLLLWTAIGVGMVAGAAHLLASRWSRRADWVPLLLFLPGVLGQLLFGGLSDALATGLALVGMAWWFDGNDRPAVTALCLAGLARETTLLVPLALLLGGDRGDRRRIRTLLPFAVYTAWVVVVWLRLDALPTDPTHGRLAFPLAGLLAVIGRWSWVEVLGAATILVLGAVAFRRAPRPEVKWLVVLSALFASTMGSAVFRSWDFTRPLLPFTVVGACLLAAKARHRTRPGEDGAEAVPLAPAGT